MEHYQKRKALLLILAACIAISVVFTEAVIAAVYDHGCTGEGCPVCMQIETAQSFLKAIKLAGISLVLAVCLVFSGQSHRKSAESIPCLFSPVVLKDRFNS
ncbi:MAG: hypothetical protein LBB81_03075 [Treponema sp.]|jgi:hypothetical protein|nr:hypothetical protein [Treponema sp.]